MEETEVQLHSGMEGAAPIPDRGPRPGDYPGREQDTWAEQRFAGGVRRSRRGGCGVLADVSVGTRRPAACAITGCGVLTRALRGRGSAPRSPARSPRPKADPNSSKPPEYQARHVM